MKIIERREFHVTRHNQIEFEGFAFDCDENGNVDESKLQPLALENYRKCIASGERGELESWEHSFSSPAVGECSCGRHVTLANFTNTCECGADYNWAGQGLAPRAQWGEETGEHPSECVGPFYDDRWDY